MKFLLHNVDFFSLNKFSHYIHNVASLRTSGYSYRETSIGKIVVPTMSIIVYRFLLKCSPILKKNSLSLHIEQA